MAPKKPNGRPRIKWEEGSRQRKLVRLYFMTDVNVREFCDYLGERDFHPGTRNIQTQLGKLVPHYSSEGHKGEYRPTKDQKRNRLHQMKQARMNRISKYQKRKSKFNLSEEPPLSLVVPTCGKIATTPKEGFEEMMPWGLPSPNVPPAINFVYSDPIPRPSENDSVGVMGLSFSDQEVMIPQQLVETCCGLSTEGRFKLSEVEDSEQKSAETSSSSAIFETVPVAITTDRSPKNAGSTRAGSIRTLGSMRTLSTQISSRLSLSSSSLRHLGSVIASSTSWRSSILYAASESSGQQSAQDLQWNEYINEEAEIEPTDLHKANGANLLHSRPCCNFIFDAGIGVIPTCNTCGFSWMHMKARHSEIEFQDRRWIDPKITDRFGNTPLHHAAAAGNISRVIELMETHRRPSHNNSQQNTSGETFCTFSGLKKVGTS